MVKAKFEWVEIFWIIFGILLLFMVLTNPLPLENNFVPNAVTGFTTMAGILAAFIGFWLTHAYSNLKDKESRKWMGRRIKAIVIAVSLGLLFVVGASNDLAHGNLQGAYEFAMLGTTIIVVVLIEIMFIIVFREEFCHTR